MTEEFKIAEDFIIFYVQFFCAADWEDTIWNNNLFIIQISSVFEE